jgi:tetratricopeptide (TPR) repeat protein
MLPGPLVPAPAFPFVGREEELATLRAALDRAEHGEGGLVLLAAEAGGGKTRLARELALDAAARGVLVLYGVSDAVVSTPYQPLREWLEFLARVLEPDVLETCLGKRRELVARLVPELGREPAAAPGTEVDRYALQSAVREVLRQVSRAQPVVLVAEDVHWADAETLQLLRRLAATASEGSMLLLATYRDRGEELGAAFSETLAELTRMEGLTRISLARLTTDEVGAFISASTDAEAPHELTGEIAELTGGTPLLLCELWRDLRESGIVGVSDERVQLSQPLAELRGPERLRDVVRHRLARLTPEAAATLELAAVSGPRFELRVLTRAAGREHSAVAVEEATRHGLLDELPDTVPACRFTHELVRRAVYDRINGIRRAQLHLRVGEALEHVRAADPTPVLPELAHHFTLAAAVAGTERAVDYNLRAGAAAVAASAFEEGAARLATALELGIDDPRDRARTQVELAHLLSEMGRLEESEAMLAASLDAATGLEERGIVARALIYKMSNRLADPAADLDEIRKVAEAARETFRQLDDHRGVAVAERYLAVVLMRQGRPEEGLVAVESALLHAEQSGDDQIRRAIVSTMGSHLCHGPTPVPDAIRRFEALLKSTGGDRVLEAVIMRFLGFLLAMADRGGEALELVQTSSRVLDELDYLTLTRVHRVTAGEARALAGDHAGAEQEFREAWIGFRDTARYAIDERAVNAAGWLAGLCCDEGRWDEAAELVAYGRELPLAETTGTALRRLCVEARLAAHDGRLDDALSLARHAVACAPSDTLNLRAGTWVALAEVQRAAGAAAEADAALDEAIRLYEAKGNAAAAARVRAAAGR